MAANFIRCLRGPKLYRKHNDGNTGLQQQGQNYQPNILESAGDRVISIIRFFYSFSYWTSPIVLTVLYRRGYFTLEGFQSLSRFLLTVGALYGAAYLSRGVGRWYNVDYLTFLGILTAAQKSLTAQNRRLLSRYDSEFWAWPVDFRWSDVNSGDVKKGKVQVPRSTHSTQNAFSQLPCTVLSYVAAHTFGRRMVYPGATALINSLVGPMLHMSRAKLVEERQGIRGKVETEDKNQIDTMFVDQRNSHNVNGKTLVICCEGNSGFYEIGCTDTPIKEGYSVLGWNHPGFGGSSGAPLPSQEQCAIDAVIQYAIHKLGFTPDNIAIFAWSIGGYAATWAAMNYPDIKYIVLDATFDDLLPLAIARMPQTFSGIVTSAVKNYINLNVADQLLRYPGPILIIRRTKDEMITTQEPVDTALHTNRGNFLLQKLLQHRYPNIIDSTTSGLLTDWLSKTEFQKEVLYQAHEVDNDVCLTTIRSYTLENSDSFPSNIGTDFSQEQKNQMTLFLASKYMEDFSSTHCTPLPGMYFHKPWTATGTS